MPARTPASAKAKPASDDSNVSQRQPSELKSTVRSLANKDEAPRNNRSSFASKKVADVDTPAAAKVAEAKVESKAITDSKAEKVGD